MATLNSTLRQFLAMDQTVYDEHEQANYRVYAFIVPVDQWKDTLPHTQYTATPVELGGSGYVLKNTINYRSEPGFVTYTMTCGNKGRWWYDSLTRVSSRQVTVREKFAFAADGVTPLSGPVAGEEETQRYKVDGDEYFDETYVQIGITSMVTSIPAGWQSANFKKRNDATINIRDIIYATGTVLYTGGSSEEVGGGYMRLVINLLAAPKVWPLTVDRYIETKKVVQLDVVNAAGTKISDSRSTQWVRAAAKTDSPAIRGKFDMGAALASLP